MQKKQKINHTRAIDEQSSSSLVSVNEIGNGSSQEKSKLRWKNSRKIPDIRVKNNDYVYRWINMRDERNTCYRHKQGWIPEKASEHPELGEDNRMVKNGGIEFSGLKLYKIPVLLHNQRKENHKIETQKQMSDYNNSSINDGALFESQKMANILNNAFNLEVVYKNGKPLCAIDHPLGNGRTNANRLVIAADLCDTAIYTLNEIRKNWIIPPPNLAPDLNLTLAPCFDLLIVPQAQRDTARRLPTPSLFRNRIIVNPYLVDDDAWFLVTNHAYSLTRKDFRTNTEGTKFCENDSSSDLVPFSAWFFGSPGGA